jgi:hypothetical protein
MTGVSERAVDHVERMDGNEILTSIDEIEKLDKVARRTFGLSDNDSHGNNVMVNIALVGSLRLNLGRTASANHLQSLRRRAQSSGRPSCLRCRAES